MAYADKLVPVTGYAATERGSFAPHPVTRPTQMGSTQQRILPIAAYRGHVNQRSAKVVSPQDGVNFQV